MLPIYSKRKKRAEQQGSAPEVYRYDELPERFRIQVIHIWRNAIGGYCEYRKELSNVDFFWFYTHQILCEELGFLTLDNGRNGNPQAQCEKFIQKAETNYALDIIELTFRQIGGFLDEKLGIESSEGGDQATIDELNERFLEHGIGYQFIDGRIMRMDSEFTHKEVTLPAIQLIREAGFSGAEDEFMQAHEHYRHADYKEALNNASKAFESVLKSICNSREWKYEQNATAIKLLNLVFEKGLISSEHQSHFSALRKTLETVPTIRNKNSAHGQGATVVPIPRHLAAYALHITASAIIFW